MVDDMVVEMGHVPPTIHLRCQSYHHTTPMSLSPLPNPLERDYSSTEGHPLSPPCLVPILFVRISLHLLGYNACSLLFCFYLQY